MEFNNTCECLVDYKILENAIIEECNRRNITPKSKYKIYMYRGYAGISLKHEKVSVHRIIGKYIVGFDFDKNVAVHHIDGDKLNNNISNLQVIKSAFHITEHNPSQYADRERLRQNAMKASDKIKRHDVEKEKVLIMRHSGLTVEQIASELRCGKNTVNRRLGMKDY